MKKILNKKGFAITSFLYSIFLLAIVFFVLILLLVANSSTNFFKFQKSVKNELDEVSYSTGGINNLYKIVFEEENPVIQKGEDFNFLEGVKLIQYDGVELNNTITYTVSPTFDNNITGKYLITYEATVNGTVVKKNRVLTVRFPIYANGQRVYFDVDAGTGCSMEEYASSYDTTATDFLNSKTDYNGLNGSEGQNSCLLFYAFNDDGGENINLILDHNTTATTNWTDASTDTNTNGPINVLSELRSATDEWNGTNIPENYTVYQESIAEDGVKTVYGNYTIPYMTEEYKSRLITAQEIAQITGADKKEGLMFEESTSDYNNYFLLETLTQSEKDCTANCEYGWLYDRTALVCTTYYGCLNNAFGDSRLFGYWTGTSVLGRSSSAWRVRNYGSLLDYPVNNGISVGVRPVIEVSKSKISPGEVPVIPE